MHILAYVFVYVFLQLQMYMIYNIHMFICIYILIFPNDTYQQKKIERKKEISIRNK